MKETTVSGSGWYHNDRSLVRIKVPSNGRIQDVTIWIDGKIVELGQVGSFNLVSNDVLVPIEKKDRYPNFGKFADEIKELFVQQESRMDRIRNDMEIINLNLLSHSNNIKRTIKWTVALIIFFMLLLSGWLTYMINPEIINQWMLNS